MDYSPVPPVFLLLQSVFLCLYVTLRYYLTYREDATMNVALSCKTLTMMTVTISGIFWLVLTEAEILNGIATICLIIIVDILSLAILAATYRRRNRLLENKLEQRTICIYFLLLKIYSSFWIVFSIKFSFFLGMYVSNNETDVLYHATITRWTISSCLAISLLNPFLTIIVDNKLRRTFFEMFRLPRYCCCCNDGELRAQLLPGDEPRPRQAVDNRPNVYNEPHQAPEERPRQALDNRHIYNEPHQAPEPRPPQASS